MNFTVGLIAAVGGLVAISLFFIAMDPGYISESPVKPVACTKEYVPVCGVDGITYGNMCTLDAADTLLDYAGECVVEKPLKEGWTRMESTVDPGVGHESHQLVLILPFSDHVYSGTLHYDATEPIQLIALHGPITDEDARGQATWTPDGVTKYAMTFVNPDNSNGEWKFAGNALAVHTKKTEPFTVDYMVEYEVGTVSDGIITGTVQSVQDPGMGHESHQLAVIIAPSSDVYSGIISYSTSEPIQLIALRGPIGPDDHPEKTWSVDGTTIFEMIFVDPANAMGSWEFSGNALALHTKNTTTFTASYSVSSVKSGESIPPVSVPPISEMPVLPTTHTVSIPQGVSYPGCETANECYLPYSLEIQAGDTVSWSNDDTAAHTVSSGDPTEGLDGIFDSGLFMAGSTFEYTFDQSGTYPYFCMVHPWMTGEVTVKEIHDVMVHEIAVGEPTVSDASIDDVKSMVSNAVALYDEIGTDSFESFNSSPDFHDGDLYLFVFQDSDSVMVAHGANMNMIGKPVNEILDIHGDSIGKMIHEKATEDGVWVEYLWEDPVDNKVHPKTSWVIIHDGYIFGSGSYAHDSVAPTVEPVEPTEKRAAPVQVAMGKGSSTPGCETANECFIPYQVEIYSGEPVVWINSDSAAHTVTSGLPATHNGLFDSGMMMPDQKWEYVFIDSGEYDYHCMLHPWMTGKVVVE